MTGLHKGDLTGESKAIMESLKDHFDHYNNSIAISSDRPMAENINLMARGMVGKELNAMTTEDYRVWDRMFQEMRRGTVKNTIFDGWKKNIPLISKWDHMRFPKYVNEKIMMTDFQLVYKNGFFQTAEGKIGKGLAAKPSFYIERMQFFTGLMKN